VDRWLRRLTTMGFARGVRGSRPWLITGMIAIGLRALRRLANPPDEVLYRTVLRPGDAFQLVARTDPPRKRRRRGQ
jgi:hypothetical protein